MSEWPTTAPLFTILIGLLVLMSQRFFGDERNKALSVRLVFVLIITALLQIALLGVSYYRSSGELLFRLDGVTTALAAVFLFSSLSAWQTLFRERDRLSAETPLIVTAYIFFGLTFLLSNHVFIMMFSWPILVVMAEIAPLLNKDTKKNIGFVRGFYKGLSHLILIVFAALPMAQSLGTYSFAFVNYETNISQFGEKFQFAWWLILLLPTVYLLPSPLHATRKIWYENKGWATFAYFEFGQILLSGLWMMKWLSLGGVNEAIVDGPWLTAKEFGFGFCLLLILSNTVVALLRSKMFDYYRAYSTLIVLCAVAAYFRLTPGAQVSGLVALAAGVLGMQVILLSSSMIHTSPMHTISDMCEFLKPTSRILRIVLALSLLLLMPGVSSASHQIIPFIAAQLGEFGLSELASKLSVKIFLALLFFVLISRIHEVFWFNAKHSTGSSTLNQQEAFLVGGGLLVFLFLGIYHTPLYNYFDHLIRLFVSNT